MKKEKYLFVQFRNSHYLYVFKIDGEFRVGDVVESPTNNYATMDIALVKKVKKLSRKDLPVDYDKILTISKKLDFREYEKDFFPIRFMKKYIKKTLIKEWEKEYKNDWVEVYSSKFGGCISYEKDGVFTGSLNKCTDNNYFEEYTITNTKDFKIKLRYFQTILSELYYKNITIEVFNELLNVI